MSTSSIWSSIFSNRHFPTSLENWAASISLILLNVTNFWMISLWGIDVVHSTIQWSDINGPGVHEHMVISLDISVKNASRVLPNLCVANLQCDSKPNTSRLPRNVDPLVSSKLSRWRFISPVMIKFLCSMIWSGSQLRNSSRNCALVIWFTAE